ncbi:MAG: F0F1 ATP synthase subunit A [Helicobacteraceae bacterium]|jgi:F-type H+-transporting ATPase subunit a|nr:F0F1 ATP synthase subunit A [Helicobacteraceae bacterium]
MEERVFTFSGWLNHLLFGLEHNDEKFFVYQMLEHSALVVLIVAILALLATRNLKSVPGGLQNAIEWFVEGTLKLGADMMGEARARKYLPLIGTLGLFIFVSNMLGIIPGFESPTANINITLVMALIVFLYYNFEGIRANGFFHYFAHFAGPVKWLSPLMFPVEVVSHLSRVISLSFRLFGNVKGDDMFLLVMLLLVPPLLPLPAFFMLFFFGLLQTFIFMILTYVYLSGAVAIEEESH